LLESQAEEVTIITGYEACRREDCYVGTDVWEELRAAGYSELLVVPWYSLRQKHRLHRLVHTTPEKWYRTWHACAAQSGMWPFPSRRSARNSNTLRSRMNASPNGTEERRRRLMDTILGQWSDLNDNGRSTILNMFGLFKGTGREWLKRWSVVNELSTNGRLFTQFRHNVGLFSLAQQLLASTSRSRGPLWVVLTSINI
jgi:hypothetical protein